jgi:lipoprotein-anchoring transpeptidase ErfK/SrfK
MRASVGKLRTRVGAIAVAAASVLSIGSVASAVVDDPPTNEETATTADSTVAPPPTAAPAPTTTEILGQPAGVDDVVTASRPGSTVQTQTFPPPPTTTTTTTLPPPPPPDILPAGSGTGRRTVYSKSRQRVWAVSDAGEVLKTHRVSGKLKWCDPKIGTYSIFSRSRYTNSIQNPTVKWGYMIRFTKGCEGGNIGFHEIPKKYGVPLQSISQLGQPLSAGCVRQATSDAVWMWNWAWVGTKVVVLP